MNRPFLCQEKPRKPKASRDLEARIDHRVWRIFGTPSYFQITMESISWLLPLRKRVCKGRRAEPAYEAAERHRHRRYFSRHVHSLHLLLAPTVRLNLLQPVKYGKNDVALSASRNSLAIGGGLKNTLIPYGGPNSPVSPWDRPISRRPIFL